MELAQINGVSSVNVLFEEDHVLAHPDHLVGVLEFIRLWDPELIY